MCLTITIKAKGGLFCNSSINEGRVGGITDNFNLIVSNVQTPYLVSVCIYSFHFMDAWYK